MPKIDKICHICKNIFSSYVCRNQKYCSRKCKIEASKGIASTPRNGYLKNCIICSKQFYVSQCREGYKCCSKICSDISKKKPNPKLRTGFFKKCEKCENIIYVKLCKKEEKRFCSRKCQYTHLKETNEWGIREKSGWKNNPYERKMINGIRKKAHRRILEEHLGRKLEKWEHVHHINENPLDNRIENLQIVTASEHAKIHLRDRNK